MLKALALWHYTEILIFAHSNTLYVSHLFTSLYCWVSEVVSSFFSSSCKETVFIKKLLSLSKQTIKLCPPLLVRWTLCALCLYLVVWEQNLKVQLSSGERSPSAVSASFCGVRLPIVANWELPVWYHLFSHKKRCVTFAFLGQIGPVLLSCGAVS